MKKILMFLFGVSLGVGSPGCRMNLRAAEARPLRSVSERFLGRPYVLGPMGEGKGYDPKPIYRDDAFDCVTFVEIVLAEWLGLDLQCLRYKDCNIDFASRNHFMYADWIPNNSHILEPVDFGLETRVRRPVIDKRRWFKELHGQDIEAEPVTIELRYVSRRLFMESKPEVDSSMIVFFLSSRADLDIEHLGLLFPHGGRLMLQHASREKGRVVEEDFHDYLKDDGRVFRGMSFYRIVPPAVGAAP